MPQLVSDGAENEVAHVSADLLPPSSSPKSLSSPVSEKDKELTQESVTETQAELIVDEPPNWLVALRAAANYNLDAARERTLIGWLKTDGISDAMALVAATAVAANWPYKHHKRIDLTLRNWALGERAKGQTNGRSSGRYVAPGFNIPKDPDGTSRSYYANERDNSDA